MSEHEQDNKVNKWLKDSWYNAKKNQPFLKNMSIPSDLGDIEPIATKLWNCDEIGLDDGQRFMSPIIMHQSNKYYKDLHFNIPMY